MTENGGQKGTLSETLHKELWVVISRYRSPLPLRIAKWALFLSITRRLYGTRWFWAWIFWAYRSLGWRRTFSTGA
jgi:hypothetical protein